MLRILVSVFMLAALWRTESLAESITTIVVNPIPNLLNEFDQEPASYNLLLNRFEDIALVFVPATRILGQFAQPDVNCLFPGSLDTMPDKDILIQSEPVKVTDAYLFKLSNDPLDLTGDTVIALRRGYLYGGIREQLNAQYVNLTTARETLKSLNLSRVDAVIGYLPDIQAAAIEEGIAMPFYDLQKPIYRSSHRFICHDSPQNRAFLNVANKHISEFLTNQAYRPVE